MLNIRNIPYQEVSFHQISGAITTGCDVLGASGESFSALLCENSPLLACESGREGRGRQGEEKDRRRRKAEVMLKRRK